MPFLVSRSLTFGLFAIIARTRALGLPSLPPQAPQSRADSYGLFSEVLPCAQNRTSRAKCFVNPIMRKAVSTVSICSSRVKPVRVIRSLCREAARAFRSYCRRRVSTKLFSASIESPARSASSTNGGSGSPCPLKARCRRASTSAGVMRELRSPIRSCSAFVTMACCSAASISAVSEGANLSTVSVVASGGTNRRRNHAVQRR